VIGTNNELADMGLLFSHTKANRTILETEQRRYKDYIIDIELIEYDREERFLVFRDTERMVGITFSAYTADTILQEYLIEESEYYEPIKSNAVASETYAWRKERGQDNWDVQIRGGLESLLEQLEDDSKDDETPVDQFNEALSQVDFL